MTNPAITIVLPTYNGSRYIRKSIESCLAQTYRDFELIIVNDCSTDATPSIIKEYASSDSRIKVIDNATNKKLPLSLNTGFEKGTGSYFTWTSDDNYYAPNALEIMLNVLKKNSSIDLVYADYTIIDKDDQVIGVRKFGDVNQSFNNWLGAGACFLYKREIHSANHGYNPAAFLIEDYDFFVRAFMKFNFEYIPSVELYFYREHDTSLTATQNTAINDISKIFLERNLKGLSEKLSTKEMGLLYRKFAVYYAVTKNHSSKYKVYLSQLAAISPLQAFVTAFYVLLKKTGYTLRIGFGGIWSSIVLLFKKK